MRNDDWNELGAQWQAAAPAADADLARRAGQAMRARRRSLYREIFGTVCALAILAWSVLRASGTPQQLLPWAAGAGTILLAWQVGHLVLRWRLGLFARATDGLAGWIRAERRRALYFIVHAWSGVAAGLFLLGWAYLTTEVMDGALASGVLAMVAVATLAWAILRTRNLLRLRRQLDAERLALEAGEGAG